MLLGAFAIEEIPKLVAGIQEAVQSWEGFGKAEREAMDRAIKDTATLHTKVLDVEKELELFGKNEAEQAKMRARWAGEDSDRARKSLLTAEGKSNAIRAQIAGVKQDLNSYTVTLGNIYENQLKVQEGQVSKLREAWKLADEQALLAQRRAAEASAALKKKETSEQDRDANKSLELARRVESERARLRMEQIRAGQEAGRVVKQLREEEEKENKALYDQGQFMEKMARQDMAWLRFQQMSLQQTRQLVPQIVLEANATRHLTQAQTFQIGVLQKVRTEAVAARNALGGMASATIQAGVAAAMSGENIGKAMAEALKSTLISIAAESAVRSLYNVGLGLYYEAIHDYPDAATAFSAAAVFGSVAVGAGAAGAAIPSGGGGRRGGPGGNQSTYGGSPGSGGGGGPTIVLNQYGPMVGTMNDLAKSLVNTINQLGTSGQVRLTAYNALTNGAKQT